MMWNIKVWKEVTSTCGHFSHRLLFPLQHLCIGIIMKMAPYFCDKTFVAIATLSTFWRNSDESMDTAMMECSYYYDRVSSLLWWSVHCYCDDKLLMKVWLVVPIVKQRNVFKKWANFVYYAFLGLTMVVHCYSDDKKI